MFRKKVLIIFIILLNNISASEYLVKNVNELKSILKKVIPGDQVVLANGEWQDAKLLFEAKGTKEKPITLRAETKGKVILAGKSTLRIAGEYLIVDGLSFKNGFVEESDVIEFRKDEKSESNFCRLTNCSIEDYNPADDKKLNKWVSLYGAHNRVDHCYFKNKSNEGCLLVVWMDDKPDYHLIDSNYFAFRPELGRNGAEIIRIGTSDWSMYPSKTIVEYNYFEQCNGEREIISNKSHNNIYRYNTFVECKGALTLRHGNNCEVYGNYFFGNNVAMTGGVRIIGEGHKVFNNYFQDLDGGDAFSALSIMNGVKDSPLNRYFQVKNAIVAFNTFVNNKNSIEIGVGKDEELSLPPINCTFANNIIYSTKGALVKYIDTPQDIVWSSNIYYVAELGINQLNGFENSDVEIISDGKIFRPNKIDLIKNKAEGNFDFVSDDIDGQKRGEKKSIGCDEILNEPILRRPLSKTDVGPKYVIKPVEN